MEQPVYIPLLELNIFGGGSHGPRHGLQVGIYNATTHQQNKIKPKQNQSENKYNNKMNKRRTMQYSKHTVSLPSVLWQL